MFRQAVVRNMKALFKETVRISKLPQKRALFDEPEAASR